MTLLMTWLTLFLGGTPTAAVPPEPAAPTVARPYEDVFAPTIPAEDPFGVPRIASAKWHSSPSLMVAAPPSGYGTKLDVFSPAVRPPHEFPTLFPCTSVTLVPPPPPLPSPEPPAIRHVSFTGEGAEFRVSQLQAQANAECEAGICPLALEGRPQFGHAAFEPHWFHPTPFGLVVNHRMLPHPAHPLHAQFHVRHHAPDHASHASPVCEAAGCPVMCPVGFCGTPDGPPSPFPGAKNVHHVVSATYDVPHETAKTLTDLLDNGNGVQSCRINGDELTVTATAPAQMAIAQFLANVVTEPRSANSPATTISVNHSEVKACPSECPQANCPQAKCTEVKACTTECSEPKCSKGECCKGECGEKCGCTCGKPKPASSEQTTRNTLDKRVFSFFVGLADNKGCAEGKACPEAACQLLGIDCHVPALGKKSTADCSPAACHPVAIHVEATETKPVIVKIQATNNGVLLETSNGTHVRAQSIRLETQGIGRLQIDQAQTTYTDPKPAPAKFPKFSVSY